MSARIVAFPEQARSAQLEEDIETIEIYQLDVTLRDTDPMIWRTILVPKMFDLEALHNVIQILFEWDDIHTYYFKRGNSFYDDEVLLIDYEDVADEIHVCAKDVSIASVLPEVYSTLEYVYDLGDNWEIEIELVDTMSTSEYPFDMIPVCVAGDGASPFEDVGGPSGHAEFIAAVSDPEHPQYDELREWAELEPDKEYDPEFFSTHMINMMLATVIVDQLEDQMVPSDPDELREGYINLLVEKLASSSERTLELIGLISRIDDLADETNELDDEPCDDDDEPYVIDDDIVKD